MERLLGDIEFWKLVAGLAWPFAILVMFFAMRRQISRLFDREEMEIEVAGLKLRVRDATKQIGQQVTELMKRTAALEANVGQPASPPEGRDSFGQQRNISLLWVDDFPSNNAFLVEKFRNDGIEVELSTSTDDALTKISQRKFDLVISDLGRIEKGHDNPFAGLDFLERLSVFDKSIPAVIYAGPRGLQNERRLKNAGAQLVTSSPIEVIAFVEHRTRMISK